MMYLQQLAKWLYNCDKPWQNFSALETSLKKDISIKMGNI